MKFSFIILLFFFKLNQLLVDRFSNSCYYFFALLNYQMNLFLNNHQYQFYLLVFCLVWIGTCWIGLTWFITFLYLKLYFLSIFFKVFYFRLKIFDLLKNGWHFIVLKLIFDIFFRVFSIGCRWFGGSWLSSVFFNSIFWCRFLIVIKDHDIKAGFFHGTVIELLTDKIWNYKVRK